jgi:hypothetical protein
LLQQFKKGIVQVVVYTPTKTYATIYNLNNASRGGTQPFFFSNNCLWMNFKWRLLQHIWHQQSNFVVEKG